MSEQHPVDKAFMMDFVRDEVMKTIVRWGLLSALALIAYVATPIGSRIVAVWNSPIILEQILYELAANRRVVDWSPATRMASECQIGRECTLIARFRRVQSAEECEIIPGATRFTFMSYKDFIPRIATKPNSASSARNIGTDFETAEITINIPTSIPEGPGELRVSSSYMNCAWQNGDEPPTSQVSPAIKVVFVN